MCVYEIIKLKYLKLRFQINCPCDYTFFVVLHIAGVSQYLDKIFTSEMWDEKQLRQDDSNVFNLYFHCIKLKGK